MEGLVGADLRVCGPVWMEVRAGAANRHELGLIDEELSRLGYAAVDERALRRAMDAQSELARARGGQHRLGAIDLLIAAIADRDDLGLLHYDSHFDRIARHSSLRFKSRWVVPRGSVS